MILFLILPYFPFSFLLQQTTFFTSYFSAFKYTVVARSRTCPRFASIQQNGSIKVLVYPGLRLTTNQSWPEECLSSRTLSAFSTHCTSSSVLSQSIFGGSPIKCCTNTGKNEILRKTPNTPRKIEGNFFYVGNWQCCSILRAVPTASLACFSVHNSSLTDGFSW